MSEREPDLDRVLTFVDAIVAIAITLLVLPLVEVPARVDDYLSVGALLRDTAPQIYAFLLSFVVVSRFWFVQHRALRRMIVFDSRIAGLLMLWALTIVFLPFPTGLVASATDSPVTKVLYVGTMFTCTALISGMQALLERAPELTDGTHADLALGVANALALALALAIMLALPSTSYWPLLLLVIADRAARLWHRSRSRKARRMRAS